MSIRGGKVQHSFEVCDSRL